MPPIDDPAAMTPQARQAAVVALLAEAAVRAIHRLGAVASGSTPDSVTPPAPPENSAQSRLAVLSEQSGHGGQARPKAAGQENQA